MPLSELEEDELIAKIKAQGRNDPPTNPLAISLIVFFSSFISIFLFCIFSNINIDASSRLSRIAFFVSISLAALSFIYQRSARRAYDGHVNTLLEKRRTTRENAKKFDWAKEALEADRLS